MFAVIDRGHTIPGNLEVHVNSLHLTEGEALNQAEALRAVGMNVNVAELIFLGE